MFESNKLKCILQFSVSLNDTSLQLISTKVMKIDHSLSRVIILIKVMQIMTSRCRNRSCSRGGMAGYLMLLNLQHSRCSGQVEEPVGNRSSEKLGEWDTGRPEGRVVTSSPFCPQTHHFFEPHFSHLLRGMRTSPVYCHQDVHPVLDMGGHGKIHTHSQAEPHLPKEVPWQFWVLTLCAVGSWVYVRTPGHAY